MKKRKTVIFDNDGVLFRTETVDITAINKALVLHGFEEKSPADILDCFGVTLEEMCEGRFGITDPVERKSFMEDVMRFEQGEIAHNGLMYEGAPEFIKRLKLKGYTICLCSNGSYSYVSAIMGKFGLLKMFDEIWAAKDGFSKSQAVACLAEKYSDGRFLMVGDRSIDIDAGRDSGAITIGTLYGFGGNEPYAADYTAGSIAELEQVIYSIFEDEFNVKESQLCVE
ncbi:MAG TPA: HAD family hydrolase [Clostridia bacterium]|nr:HAD family hydrolase [Clostridia bacterium]